MIRLQLSVKHPAVVLMFQFVRYHFGDNYVARLLTSQPNLFFHVYNSLYKDISLLMMMGIRQTRDIRCL